MDRLYRRQKPHRKNRGGVVNFKIYADGQQVFSREGVTAADRDYTITAAVLFLAVLSVPDGAAGIFFMLKKYR